MTAIRFTVIGEPQPQPRPRARVVYPGGKPTAVIYSPLDTRVSAKKRKTPFAPDSISVGEWKERCARAAREAFRGYRPIENPVCVRLSFRMKRQEQHFRTTKAAGRLLKLDAPIWHGTADDWDNLAKAFCDSVNGICWTDDEIVAQAFVEKRYVRPGEVPHLLVVLCEPEPDFVEPGLPLVEAAQ